MNKRLIIYAVLLATVLLSAFSRVAYAQTWTWTYLTETSFNPSWTISMSNNTEQTKSGSGYAELESTNVSDFIHPDVYDNSSSRQVIGFFAVFDIKVIEAGSGSAWIWLQARDSSASNRTSIGIDPYNTTHYRLLPMPHGQDFGPSPRTGFLREGEWYDLEWHAGQNATIATGQAIYYSWIRVYRTYPTDYTESNVTYGPGYYMFQGVFQWQQWNVGVPASTATRDRDYYYIPLPATEEGDPAEEYLTEPRLYIMLLIIGLGMFLVPPSYIAWQRPDAATVVMLLFVMLIGMGLLIAVGHYTP